MIQFSFSSVLMTILTSNLLLILVTLLFRNVDMLSRIGYKLTAVYCAITFMRFLLPYELPFTKTVLLPANISKLFSMLRHRYEIFSGIRLSVWDAFCIVWLAGSLVYVGIFLYRYGTIRVLALRNSREITDQEPYASILRELCDGKRHNRIHLYSSPFAGSPMIIGLFRPIILLPKDIDPSDTDIMYALRHEICHYIHHDLWLKLGVNCLAAVYWWNPFSHLLSRQFDTLLEIRVDASIISEGNDASIAYVASMLHYMADSQGHSGTAPGHLEMFLEKRGDLWHRLQMIRYSGRKPNYLLSLLMLLAVVSLYLGSYLFIFENCSYDSLYQESDAYIVPDEENCYAIENPDGTYTVYFVDWDFPERVDSLEHYHGIEIYSSEEEYHEKNNR